MKLEAGAAMTPAKLPHWKTAVKIVGSKSLRSMPSLAEWDERERDSRPGRFAVTGPFIRLADLTDGDTDDESSAPQCAAK